MHKYRLKKKIGEGTFAEVLMAKNPKKWQICCY